MKLFVAALFSSALGITTSALAADLPQTGSADSGVFSPVNSEPIDWSGFYLGGQFGYGWFTGEDNLGNPETDLDDVIGGIHAGYNHTFENFLVGLEVEANLAGFDGKTSLGLDANVDWMLAGRIRAGYTFDRYLAFATAGISAAELSLKSVREDSNTHTGLVVGGGLEAFVTENLTARIEYQHHWFNEQTYNTNTLDYKVDGQMDVVRAGLSYHF